MADLTMGGSPSGRRRRRAAAATPEPPPPEIRAIKWESLAVAVGLFAQLGGGVWWASGMSSRVTSLESTVAPLSQGKMAEQIGRIDERTTRTASDVDRIEIWMRHLSDRLESRLGRPVIAD